LSYVKRVLTRLYFLMVSSKAIDCLFADDCEITCWCQLKIYFHCEGFAPTSVIAYVFRSSPFDHWYNYAILLFNSIYWQLLLFVNDSIILNYNFLLFNSQQQLHSLYIWSSFSRYCHQSNQHYSKNAGSL
jgi:hypothetical protein